MNGSTLALCIPAYNAAWCLPRVLEAARRQEPPFDEILVHDDCSTDATSEVAAAFGARVIRADVNRGAPGGKNRLAREAKSEWVTFIDADDLILPHFTRIARDWMTRPDAPDVVLFNYQYRDLSTDQLISVRNFDDAALRADPLGYALREQLNNFGFYRRATFLDAGGFDEDPAVLFNEDVAMHVRLAGAGLRFRAESTVSAINYRVAGSMSGANSARCWRAHLQVMRNAATRFPVQYHATIGEKLWLNAGYAAACSDWSTARESADFACSLGVRFPRWATPSFRIAAGLLGARAVFLREGLIRAFKRHLRAKPHESLRAVAEGLLPTLPIIGTRLSHRHNE
jgi:glycosyltransferase involved in cell wall biosynthesis